MQKNYCPSLFFLGNQKKSMAAKLVHTVSNSFISIGKSVIATTESKQGKILSTLQKQKKEIEQAYRKVEIDLNKSITEKNEEQKKKYL